eukprot:SAG11_NODE_3320_length_2525_cov_2.455070_1_plen_86_part_00
MPQLQVYVGRRDCAVCSVRTPDTNAVAGNFHQPGSLVQANPNCEGNRSAIVAAGVDGLSIIGETSLNAAPSRGVHQSVQRVSPAE